ARLDARAVVGRAAPRAVPAPGAVRRATDPGATPRKLAAIWVGPGEARWCKAGRGMVCHAEAGQGVKSEAGAISSHFLCIGAQKQTFAVNFVPRRAPKVGDAHLKLLVGTFY